MTGIIYKYTGPNGKSYIGQTIHEKIRQAEHKKAADNGKQTKFCRAIRKYGFENFDYSVLVSFETENRALLDKVLDIFEIYYIAKFKTIKHGYNITKGGEGGTTNLGKKVSKEIRRKHSLAMKGRKLSEEHKAKISQALKGRKITWDNRPKKIETLTTFIGSTMTYNDKIYRWNKKTSKYYIFKPNHL